MDNETSAPVWFITGCSSGFGLELARQALARGKRVVATARDTQALAARLQGPETRLLLLDLDVTDNGQIGRAVDAATQQFGAIDVLVNNAGYGYQAAAEEGEDALIRAMFDTNVFGLFAVTRAVLPGMRERRRGHVLNIGSVAGLVGLPASGYYAAAKHAVEGFSDALLAEAGPLGIRVTCVEPGPFRTDFAGRSLHQTHTAIADYETTAGARMRAIVASSGRQAGDPARAAVLMLDVAEHPHPPRHLVLGAVGWSAATGALQATLAELQCWRDSGVATDFPPA